MTGETGKTQSLRRRCQLPQWCCQGLGFPSCSTTAPPGYPNLVNREPLAPKPKSAWTIVGRIDRTTPRRPFSDSAGHQSRPQNVVSCEPPAPAQKANAEAIGPTLRRDQEHNFTARQLSPSESPLCPTQRRPCTRLHSFYSEKHGTPEGQRPHRSSRVLVAASCTSDSTASQGERVLSDITAGTRSRVAQHRQARQCSLGPRWAVASKYSCGTHLSWPVRRS